MRRFFKGRPPSHAFTAVSLRLSAALSRLDNEVIQLEIARNLRRGFDSSSSGSSDDESSDPPRTD